MWTILGFIFAVVIFFVGYAIGWAHGIDDWSDWSEEDFDEDDEGSEE